MRDLNDMMDGISQGGSILLVVRNTVIRTDLLELLSDAGFQVLTFGSHAEAEEALAGGLSPKGAIFDTPLDAAPARSLERRIIDRGIPFLRLASLDSGALLQGCGEPVIVYPFSMTQILDALRQQFA